MKPLRTILLEEVNKQSIFVVVKPGFLNLAQTIIERFENNGYHLEKIRTKRLLLSEAQQLYVIHKKEGWYKQLCQYMSSEPTTAIIFSKDCKDIFKDSSNLKDEIRKEFGESDMRNVIHSSDSQEHMDFESSLYF